MHIVVAVDKLLEDSQGMVAAGVDNLAVEGTVVDNLIQYIIVKRYFVTLTTAVIKVALPPC